MISRVMISRVMIFCAMISCSMICRATIYCTMISCSMISCDMIYRALISSCAMSSVPWFLIPCLVPDFGCPSPSHTSARFLACPVVPLSRDNEGTSVPLSQKVALSVPLETLEYSQTWWVCHTVNVNLILHMILEIPQQNSPHSCGCTKHKTLWSIGCHRLVLFLFY